MLFGAIVLSASAKSFKLSNFLEQLAKGWKFFLGVETSDLFCLPLSPNPSRLKFKFLILLGSTSFLHGSHSFEELVYEGFVSPFLTAASTLNIAAAT